MLGGDDDSNCHLSLSTRMSALYIYENTDPSPSTLLRLTKHGLESKPEFKLF